MTGLKIANPLRSSSTQKIFRKRRALLSSGFVLCRTISWLRRGFDTKNPPRSNANEVSYRLLATFLVLPKGFDALKAAPAPT